MEKLNELLTRHDFSSLIFREHLITSGQISLQSIMTAEKFKSDLAYHKEKIFVKRLQPMLTYCDCMIRFKDLVRLDFDFVFIIKKEIIHEVVEYLTVGVYDIKPEQVVDPDILIKYVKEINKNNITRFEKLIYAINGEIDPIVMVNEFDNNMKNVIPYQDVKITLDLNTVTRLLIPEWQQYMKKMVTFAHEHIEQKQHAKQVRIEFIEGVIERYQLYWDASKSKIPDYPALISSVLKEVYQTGEMEITKQEIEQFFIDDTNFIMIKKDIKNEERTELNELFQKQSYRISRSYDNKVTIDENGSMINVISSEAAGFLRRKIRELLFPSVAVIIDDTLRGEKYNDKVLVIYSTRIIDIIIMAINQQNYDQLVILLKLIKEEKFEKEREVYELVILTVLNCIEVKVTCNAIREYITASGKGMNLWYRFLNFLFSPWKEAALKYEIKKQSSVIDRTIETFFKKQAAHKITPSTSRDIDYDPIQSALNVISEELNTIEIREILASDATDDRKVQQIFSLYSGIGSTNKAVITKNEKSTQEFIRKLTQLV